VILGLSVGLFVKVWQASSGITKQVSLSAGHPSPFGHAGLVSQL
jgi:hypothetical protein